MHTITLSSGKGESGDAHLELKAAICQVYRIAWLYARNKSEMVGMIEKAAREELERFLTDEMLLEPPSMEVVNSLLEALLSGTLQRVAEPDNKKDDM